LILKKYLNHLIRGIITYRFRKRILILKKYLNHLIRGIITYRFRKRILILKKYLNHLIRGIITYRLRKRVLILKKYLSEREVTDFLNIKESFKEDIITISCVGLYNHGKSTLLNALIKDFDLKTFKTADARETTSNKSIIYKNIKYVDTPGLNAQEKDDQKVMKAIQTSDITLFVHTLTAGELNKKEVEFLDAIKKNWKDSQELIERTLFVLTRTDKVTRHEDIANTENKVKEQIQTIFQSPAVIISTSSKDYIEGMLHDEGELIVESNIQLLEEKISLLAKKSMQAIKATKTERFESKYWELYQKLDFKMESYESKIVQLREKQKKQRDSFQKAIESTEETLARKYAKLS